MTADSMNSYFDHAFQSLTGLSPFKWQRRLFQRFVGTGLLGEPNLPNECALPTGLGKTSIIVIWLLALAHQAINGGLRLPRRLVYIVNRRTVVDQATTTVERLRKRLMEPENTEWHEHAQTLKAVADALRSLCASNGIPLGVSTLRGQLADNEEWKSDPARPAVIIGTIDMVGSKLLFSGYGDRRYGRALHAGLMGNDTLIVHDEAHLAPPFSDLLKAVSQEQGREASRNGQSSSVIRPVRLIEMSATIRGGRGDSFSLGKEDEDDRTVQQRLMATKRLYLHEAPRGQIAKEVGENNNDKIIDKHIEKWTLDEIVKRAAAHRDSACKVLIYLRTPEKAKEVATSLAKELGTGGEGRIALLTGTMRGYERDILVEKDPVYRALLEVEADVDKSVYLVCTPAGEVGIDLDADHMVCDLTTLDALIQRLGRVNRRGGDRRKARVDVVAGIQTNSKPAKKEKTDKLSDSHKALTATLKVLKRWLKNEGGDGIDVGPKNLQKLLGDADPVEIQGAFSPRPPSRLLTDILLDNWSLTSIDKMPGRIEVGPFLHGFTADPPETFVAWRHEVMLLDKAAVEEDSLSLWFGACRIEAREKLHDRTDRVKNTLEKLSANLTKKDALNNFRVVLLDERGNASWSFLSELSGANLDYRTVVLPVEAGGLDQRGMLEPDSEPREDLDVAELVISGLRRERWIHRQTSEGNRFERLVSGEVVDAPPDGLREKQRIPLARLETEDADADICDLVLFVSPPLSTIENPETASAIQPIDIDKHTKTVEVQMSRIADRLGLEQPVREALIAAARWHDKGKDRPVWQRYAHNEGGGIRLAKSKRYRHPRALGGYRHEFGSLLDAMNDAELKKLEDWELALHLIATHHGWARPHFDRKSFDTKSGTAENERAFAEVPRRFAQLQQKYGRWGLAWLEALLRCADIVASQSAALSGEPSVREVNP